jgi:glycerol dehydrogenase-like iron-containing ADH family enzyme
MVMSSDIFQIGVLNNLPIAVQLSALHPALLSGGPSCFVFAGFGDTVSKPGSEKIKVHTRGNHRGRGFLAETML